MKIKITRWPALIAAVTELTTVTECEEKSILDNASAYMDDPSSYSMGPNALIDGAFKS